MRFLKPATRALVLGTVALAMLATGSHAQIRFAFVPGENTLLHNEREAELLAEYLQRHLQAPVLPVTYATTSELVTALTTGDLDLAVLPNTAWLGAQDHLAVVANFTRSEAPTHKLLLLTAKRRGFTSVADLLATTPDLVLDQDVASRHYFLIEQTGRTTADAFRSTHVPRRTVMGISGVLNDTYSAACVESSVLETVERFDQGMARQLHVLASAGPYASDPIVVPKTGASLLTQKLSATLLAMAEDSRGQQILLGLKIARFTEPLLDPALYPQPVKPRPAVAAAKPRPAATPAPARAAEAPAPAPAATSRADRTAADEKKRREAYASVVELDTAEAYGAFVALYPDSPQAGEARRRMNQLQAEDKLYREAKGSEEKLTAFLALFPDGRHSTEAKSRIGELRASRMETDYWKATAKETPAALRAFLAKWPDSERGPAVRKALAVLEAAAQVEEPPKPTTPVQRTWRLQAPFVSKAPSLTGLGGDKVWGRATTLEVPLEGSTGPKTLRLTAVHDGTSIYLLSRWRDPTRDANLDPWLWDAAASKYVREERLSDGLGVFWYRDPAPPTSCMISGDEVDADAWMWRPQWSDLSGHADDWTLRVSKNRLPKSNPYPALGGRGQVWVRRAPDTGEPGWRFVVPLENKGDTVPSYAVRQCTESRCDIAAAGRWEAKQWSVLMVRALDTTRDDDVRLTPGKTVKASFAVYDRAGREDHAASPLVEVELGPLR